MTDRLEIEQSLGVGESIASSNGVYQLVLQSDGNLVLYNTVFNRATWASGTAGQTATQAVLEQDGLFVIYGSLGRTPGGAIWSSINRGGAGTTLIMQNDGNLVLYTSNGSPVWATNTAPQPHRR